MITIYRLYTKQDGQWQGGHPLTRRRHVREAVRLLPDNIPIRLVSENRPKPEDGPIRLSSIQDTLTPSGRQVVNGWIEVS